MTFLLFLLNAGTLNVQDRAPVPPGAHTLVPPISGPTLPPLWLRGGQGSEASAESVKEELLSAAGLTQVSSERQTKPRKSANPRPARREPGAAFPPSLLSQARPRRPTDETPHWPGATGFHTRRRACGRTFGARPWSDCPHPVHTPGGARCLSDRNEPPGAHGLKTHALPGNFRE